MCGCQNQNNGLNQTYPRILIPCAEERTIHFNPCCGYYFDDPCCPQVYIGNSQSTRPTNN